MIVIGIDPHKKSHTAVAVNALTGEVMGQITVAARRRGHERLVAWARRLDEDLRFAIEDCRHVSLGLESLLIASAEQVVRVPPKMMGRARAGARTHGKSDPIDATAVARAALAHPDLPVATLSGPEREIRLLVDYRERCYLGHAARQGRLLVADDATRAKEAATGRLVARGRRGRPARGRHARPRRSDVRDLNEAARILMHEAGRLGDRALVAGEREFRTGDRVVCRRNDPVLGVRNGTRGSVREVDPVLGIVTLQPDGGTARQLPARYAAEHLEHGYALTGHAAQGTSVERAFVLVRAEGALAEWGYVTASRARAETRLYAIGPELDRDARLDQNEPGPTTHRLAGALSRSAAEPAALERLETTGAGERTLTDEEPGEPLRLEHARLLGELARGGPPDPAPQLRRLQGEREGLGTDLARAEAERERAESARAQIGRFRMLGRTGQEEAAHHQRGAPMRPSAPGMSPHPWPTTGAGLRSSPRRVRRASGGTGSACRRSSAASRPRSGISRPSSAEKKRRAHRSPAARAPS